MTRSYLQPIVVTLVAFSLLAGSGCICNPSALLDPFGLFNRRSLAIPDQIPLGSVNRAHYQAMETNGEAVDFIINRNEFVGSTAELTPDGKDHVMEVAARMRQAPYPVIVERSDNNSDPEVDQARRNLIAKILTDFGNADAEQRTVVAPAYGKGINSREAEFDYYRFLSTRGRGSQSNGYQGSSFGGGRGSF